MTEARCVLAVVGASALALGCVAGPQVHGPEALTRSARPTGHQGPGAHLRPSNKAPGGSFDETLESLLGGVHTSVNEDALGRGGTLRPADELWIIGRDDVVATVPAPTTSAGGGLHAQPGAVATPDLVLMRTAVSATIVGSASTVDVRQRYQNPHRQTIEAVYSFPLPHDAAVSDFVMTIGKRRIRGIIRAKKQATDLYRQARRAGYVASLLSLERPNVFEHKIANIEPGKHIDVHLRYHHVLPFQRGGYSFVVPRSGPSASVSVDIEAGVPIESVRSASHSITTRRISASRWKVQANASSSGTHRPRDFVLHYGVAGRNLKAAYLGHAAANGGYFSLMLHSPQAPSHAARSPLEMIFVVDCSASMRGAPLHKARRLVGRALSRLGPADTFQIVRFSSRSSQLGGRMIRATPANVARARRYLGNLRPDPSARMVDGLRAALALPHDTARLRVVSLVTDGYIGSDKDVLQIVRDHLGAARVFSVGVGGVVNRYLLERIAKQGRGAAAFVGLQDTSAENAVAAFYRQVSRPALTDVRLDFGAGRVRELLPGRVPDLFPGRSVTITGRIAGDLPSEVTVHGRVAGKPVALRVPIAAAPLRTVPALRRTWARAKVADLADQAIATPGRRSLAREIERLALRHGILTSMTSLVTVDAASVTKSGPARRVTVPTHMPETSPYTLPSTREGFARPAGR